MDDHRNLGVKLKLWHLQEDAPGMVFWHPRGYAVYRVLEDYLRRIFLQVPKLELNSEISVVEIIHGCIPCEGKKRTETIKNQKRPRPSPAGPFLGEERLSLARTTRRRSAVSGRRGGQCG